MSQSKPFVFFFTREQLENARHEVSQYVSQKSHSPKTKQAQRTNTSSLSLFGQAGNQGGTHTTAIFGLF